MTDAPEPRGLPPALETDALDHDGDGHKGGSKPKLVWVVVKGVGLHQVATSEVSAAISHGKGRRATARDLEIAGVPADDRET